MMAATAVHRLTFDPRPCIEIPVFPVSDRPYFVAPTLIIFQQIKKKSEFSFLVMGKWISKPLLSVGK
jgi:hypothetical protein